VSRVTRIAKHQEKKTQSRCTLKCGDEYLAKMPLEEKENAVQMWIKIQIRIS